MKKLIIIAFLFLVACAPSSNIQPTMFSTPPGFLKGFPLDTITLSQLTMEAGPPNDTITIDGHAASVYRFGQSMGVRSYTFIEGENGLVSEVLYNDMGSYNGSTARKYQGKL